MKTMFKIAVALGFIAGITAISHAGTPQEAFYMSQPNLSNTTIFVTTATTVGTSALNASIAAPSCNAGTSTIPGRNCFTKFFIQIETMSIVNVLDGGTTIQVIYGAGIGTTGTNSLTLTEDHLGPFCTTAGNATTFNMPAPVGGIAANPQVINAEGYTSCGGTANKGPLY